MSLIRPNLASSWNIRRIGLTLAKLFTISSKALGSFFPAIPCLWVSLRMMGVGGELAPPVTCQHAVHAGQRQGLSQLGFDGWFDSGDDHHATRGGIG
ncbi:MAG: hypothetical protein Q7K57_13715 [Burkholderiaceae bacterium]|nr:hypothetical protein [Burkholderiaceae bacterium]